MKIRAFLLILCTSLLFAACTSTAVTPTPTAGPTGDPGDPGYPAPETYEPPYPVESQDREIFEQNLTPNAPDPEFSADTGALLVLLSYPDGERPVRGQLFHAAGTLPVQGVEGGFLPVLDAENDPSGHSDAQGKLVISNIAPGKYALTLMTPLGPILIEDAATREAIIFEITAGSVTDLGTIAVFLEAETLEP